MHVILYVQGRGRWKIMVRLKWQHIIGVAAERMGNCALLDTIAKIAKTPAQLCPQIHQHLTNKWALLQLVSKSLPNPEKQKIPRTESVMQQKMRPITIVALTLKMKANRCYFNLWGKLFRQDLHLQYLYHVLTSSSSSLVPSFHMPLRWLLAHVKFSLLVWRNTANNGENSNIKQYTAAFSFTITYR